MSPSPSMRKAPSAAAVAALTKLLRSNEDESAFILRVMSNHSSVGSININNNINNHNTHNDNNHNDHNNLSSHKNKSQQHKNSDDSHSKNNTNTTTNKNNLNYAKFGASRINKTIVRKVMVSPSKVVSNPGKFAAMVWGKLYGEDAVVPPQVVFAFVDGE